MAKSQRFGFERTFVGESHTRREANGLSVLSTKPFTSSLNPSHKGKGDSGEFKMAWSGNYVLILVIKERVIPTGEANGSFGSVVLILVIKERVISEMIPTIALRCMS